MKKTITIFLASSEELSDDRDAFRRFISNENDRLDKYNIYLYVDQWEYSFSPLMPEGNQAHYNQRVKESDVLLCLFYRRAGPYTQQEFDSALEQFNVMGKPLIYVWLKTGEDDKTPVPGETKDLRNFRKRLMELEHFYKRYHSSDHLHIQFRNQLDMMVEKGLAQFQQEKRQATETEIENYRRKYRRHTFIRGVTYIVIAALAVLGTIQWFRYRQQLEPFSLKVGIENTTPSAELPGPVGSLLLTYGAKTETRDSVKTEALFESIPGNYRHDSLRLRFNAAGFVEVDTVIVYQSGVVRLPARRNNDLAAIRGFVINKAGLPLDDVRVFTDCCGTYTDSTGRFELTIPFTAQRISQRLSFFKDGYQPVDVNTPVIPGEMVRWVLKKL